jgi:hypothetical protein
VIKKKLNLVFLMETKLRKNKMETIQIKLGFANMLMVNSVDRSGGLTLLWEEVCGGGTPKF